MWKELELKRHSQAGALTILLCFLMLANGRVFAGRLFVWVDSDGEKHYSDRAPAGLTYRETVVRPASGSARPGFETGIRNAEHDRLKEAQRENSEIEKARQAAAKQLEQRKANCRQARTRYHQETHRPGTRNNNYKSLLQKMNRACD
jgi:hypothetical protein